MIYESERRRWCVGPKLPGGGVAVRGEHCQRGDVFAAGDGNGGVAPDGWAPQAAAGAAPGTGDRRRQVARPMVAKVMRPTAIEAVIPDAGHWLMEEQPAALVEVVHGFFDARK